jgi:hypothetical protein
MSRMESLLKQVTRAERIAKGALDALTVNRLASFAAQCGEDRPHSRRVSVGLPGSHNELCAQDEDR